MKILAIDDNHDNLLTLKALLKIFMPEANLITSASAQDGIRRALLEAPDTILLDIQMPVMDGYEATRRLKGNPSTQHIPIILVTAHRTDPSGKVRGLECGADAFLSKPIDEAELVAQIRAMVRIKRSEDALRQERDSLEALVQKRTSELLLMNQVLTENLARLAENEARYTRAVRGTTDGLWDWNVVTGECYFSPRWKELLGFADDELENRVDTFYSRLHPDDMAVAQEALESHLSGKTSLDVELRLRNREGGYLRFRVRGQAEWDSLGAAVRLSGALSDVTERQLMEEQLRQSQKMEAVGQLAGGVAHDFNNILTVIAGYANMLMMDLPALGNEVRLAEQIAIATERAAELTKGLLAFSRKQPMAPQKLDLGEIVQRVETFLTRVIGEDIQLKTHLLPDSLPVWVDMGQIEQVLINLAANARDAMENGGTFTIATGLFEDDSLSAFCGPAGSYAVIIVSDNGKGMPAEISKRIFEPFFTTKEVGKGTGLGMAIVYGIVQQHRGYITVDSKPGDGTVFSIYLPLAADCAEMYQEPAVDQEPEMGTETILVAEDDPSVRNLVDMVLTKHGYQVILAENGQEVVERFTAHSSDIGLILMDIIMPRKNGIEAFAEIKKLQPEAKVLFTSGYTSDFIQSRGMEDGVELIMKPVQPAQLLRKVREVLER
ncbi:response receiver sensor histidine kinase response regulator, PAS domain-containing [Citrifermentans bemidjiense Bem]|uniref:histidine kinase n=1 Tax=Citrifermentans bemidjiense (strain ATCC BAA-1014 / DSM 16622 / JCM 12645 / Bem) TaxID=404380 RepID=B5EGL9_CITBB|nr:response regulator [Citrifermentans bemidjiense]ACH39502.1 response receiver sensor histidine kinase response regulator, PAS domain-containing [Citrifermentans bemidjiense Bem]